MMLMNSDARNALAFWAWTAKSKSAKKLPFLPWATCPPDNKAFFVLGFKLKILVGKWSLGIWS